MIIKIVYFAYLIPNKWEPIVTEQLDALKKIDLYEKAQNIYISIISNDSELIKLKNLLSKKYSKIEIKNIYKENVYEYPGIKTLYQIAEDDDNICILYFHSKGMTSNQHQTREYLFKYTIENYMEGINEFKKNNNLDVVCAIPHINGFAYFNFFWVRSSYVRNYCSRPEISDNRYIWEVWIGNEFSRKKNIITYSPIIKYNQVKSTDEVWTIPENMINNKINNDKVNNDNNDNIKTLNVSFDEQFNVTVIKDTKIKESLNNKKEPLINKKEPLINNNKEPLINNNKEPLINKKEPLINKKEPLINNKKEPLINNKKEPLINNKKEPLINNKKEPLINNKEPLINNKKEPLINKKEIKINDSNLNNNNLSNINPYSIYEKNKNQNMYVLDLGADIGHNTYILSKRFKKVIALETENLTIINENIKKFNLRNIIICNKQLVNIKKNLETNITIKELVYNYIYSINEKLGFINCDLKGLEEDIIEDLYHIAFINKCKIFIKFNFDKWQNPDINRYNYLFNYFIYNKLLNNEFILFEPNYFNNLQLIKNNMSIMIISYNQYTYVSNMVKQLEKYTTDIVIVDNNSTYQPLLNYYNNEFKYTLLKMNKNIGHKVYESEFVNYIFGNIFIITDPDLRFNSKLPNNFINEMVKVSNEYKAGRVGFALLIDTPDIREELTYAGVPLKIWEGRFWQSKMHHPTLELYNAAIDTTFCLLNTIHNIHGLSIRVGGLYTCKHLPWHKNYYKELLDDEYDQYLINNVSTNFWYDDNKKKIEPSNVKQTVKPIIKPDKNLKNKLLIKSVIKQDDIIEDKIKDKIEDKIKNNQVIKPIIKPIIKLDNKVDNKVDNKEDNLANNQNYKFLFDDWIINKIKDKLNNAINISYYNDDFNDYFNQIITTKYKIVNFINSNNEITFKQFIYEELFLKQNNKSIKFINLNYDGHEELILEDILYYCYINNVTIYIQFNINKWIDKNINRYNYLFQNFDCYENNEIISNLSLINKSKILFILKKNIINLNNIYKKNIPAVIIAYNNLNSIKKIIIQLEKYTNDIIIIDNNSTCLKLLSFYKDEYKYTLFKQNKNYGYNIHKKPFINTFIGPTYLLTEVLVEFNKQLPDNFIDQFIDILNYFQAESVGFAINNNYQVNDNESKNWIYKLLYKNYDIYLVNNNINTFSLINKNNNGGNYRIGGNFIGYL